MSATSEVNASSANFERGRMNSPQQRGEVGLRRLVAVTTQHRIELDGCSLESAQAGLAALLR